MSTTPAPKKKIGERLTFDEFHRTTALGLSRCITYLPVLLRVNLLILFLWYCLELFENVTDPHAKVFLGISVGLFILTLTIVIVATFVYYYRKDKVENNAEGKNREAPI